MFFTRSWSASASLVENSQRGFATERIDDYAMPDGTDGVSAGLSAGCTSAMARMSTRYFIYFEIVRAFLGDETKTQQKSSTAAAAHHITRRAMSTSTSTSRDWWEAPLPGAEAFAGLCAEVGDVVRCGAVGDEAGGGRGLFATADIEKGSTIFHESPALLVQDPRNRAAARACGCCHALLVPESGSENAETGQNTSPGTSIKCAWGCGESYCDETCAQKHITDFGHRVFCVGPLDTWSHPIAALRLEAAKDDDQDGLLAMLLEICARILHQASKGDASDEKADVDVLFSALKNASLDWFVRGAWWDTSGYSARREELMQRCDKMAQLLTKAAVAAVDERLILETESASLRKKLYAVSNALGDERTIAELLSLVTRNQISVVVERKFPGASTSAPTSPESTSLPGYDGSGVFPLTCLMNHSCEPNAEVRFDASLGKKIKNKNRNSRAPTARVVAIRNIKTGDELTHAYIDTTRPAQLRAADLAGFGFKCDCGKCARARGGAR